MIDVDFTVLRNDLMALGHPRVVKVRTDLYDAIVNKLEWQSRVPRNPTGFVTVILYDTHIICSDDIDPFIEAVAQANGRMLSTANTYDTQTTQ